MDVQNYRCKVTFRDGQKMCDLTFHSSLILFVLHMCICLIIVTGIISTVGFIGPALSYGLGGLFSKTYVTLEGMLIN